MGKMDTIFSILNVHTDTFQIYLISETIWIHLPIIKLYLHLSCFFDTDHQHKPELLFDEIHL